MRDAERDAYVTDGDNYLDVCLALAGGAAKPAEVTVVCGPTTQISMPKGLRRASNGLAPRADMKCKRHAVAVKWSPPPSTIPAPAGDSSASQDSLCSLPSILLTVTVMMEMLTWTSF